VLIAHFLQVLVSHHAELLLRAAAVHHLIDMDRGRIRCSGTVDELMKSGDLPEILAEEEAELEKEVVDDEAAMSSSLDEGTKVATPTSAGDDKVPPKHLFKKLVKEEERQYGSVQWSTYKCVTRRKLSLTTQTLFNCGILGDCLRRLDRSTYACGGY
jgi:hypothetical protein